MPSCLSLEEVRLENSIFQNSMKTYKINGYVELQFYVEVEAETKDEAMEEAYEYIDQDKLDAIHITGMQHLTLFDEMEEV